MIALAVWLAALPILWACFVVVMKMAVNPPTGVFYPPAYAFFIAAYAWDIACNWFVLPIIFLELPHEFTVSARIQGHVNDNRPSWRRSLAVWFAVTLINPYSPTPHIHL